MTRHAHVLQVCDTIKRVMRKQKKTNSELASALGVSLATAKRIIGQQEALSLERLIQISDWLQLEADELLAMAKQGLSEPLDYLSEDDEELLASDDRLWTLFNFLYNGFSLSEILERFGTERRAIDKYLVKLENHNLIKIAPNGEAKVKRLQSRMRPGGPLFQRHFESLSRAFTTLVKHAGPSVAKRSGADMIEPLWFKATDYEMHREEFLSYSKELKELLEKYGKRYTWASKADALKGSGRLYC